MQAPLEWTLWAVEGSLWLLLFAASVHLLRLARWGLSQPPLAASSAPPIPEVAPLVTVQLPLRNERDVAARLLQAVGALDWPRLEVQVLDDSDDDTAALVDRAAAELRARGLDASVIRRGSRQGFKAGALQHGLSSARGEYVLILDADAQPAPELVRRLIAPFLAAGADPTLAFVQARWSFVNERESLLTRLQAIILHALFTVEQARLSAAKRPLQFNGTAGLWRRRALDQAGGWLGAGAASVTEDLELSYRLRLLGLRGETRPEIAVATELPSTMAAFRTQQSRWVRGSAEVLRALGRRLFAGSLGDGVSMLAHLSRHARQPLLLLLSLALPAAAFGFLAPAREPPHAWTIILLLTLGAIAAYHAVVLRRLGRSPAAALVIAPLVAAISVGLSFALTSALAGGLFGARGEFVRTPKRGDAGASSYRAGGRVRLVELLLGLLHLAAAAWLLVHGAWLSALALAFFFAFGFLWVGVG